jgi:hypothetical protein
METSYILQSAWFVATFYGVRHPNGMGSNDSFYYQSYQVRPHMKSTTLAALLFLLSSNCVAAAPLPEVESADIEYQSPRAAYNALRNKQGVAFSRDDSEWTVAFDKIQGVIWSFAPASEPSFPIVVKRTVLEKEGHLFIKMDVLCGGTKEACDSVVRRYTAINEEISRNSKKKSGTTQ